MLATTLSAVTLALTLAAGMLIASRDDVRAGRQAQRVLEIDAEVVEAFVDLAQRRAGEAERRFLRVLELDPANPDARTGRLLALMRLGQDERALELLSSDSKLPSRGRLAALATGAPLPPADPEFLERASASELFVEGEILRAEAQRRPQSERVGWLREAYARFDEAVVRAPQARALYHMSRAWAAAEADDERGARSASAALASLWPDSARALYMAGTVLADFDARDGLALLERSVALDGEYAPAWQCIGATYGRMGQWERAIEPLQRALAVDPRDVEAFNTLGCAWMDLGCPDEARVAFLSALSIDHAAIRPWGNLCKLAPDEEGTERAAEIVIGLDPGQTMYRYLYGEMLRRRGERERARDEFARCVAEAPRVAPIWLSYAALLLELGEAQTALDAAACARSAGAAEEQLEGLEAHARFVLEFSR
jgi:tetratricopeptide (TPR) repeat protein